MSQYEVHAGQLMKIDKLNTTHPEEWCEVYCKENGIVSLKYYDNWEDCFNSEFYKEFITHKNDIYRIIKDTECSGSDIFNASKDGAGKIDYILGYYNGGCGYSEALTRALDTINE